jgi:toxin ParE1/3/4
MKIIWDSKATEDLNENIKYIAKKSPQNALMVLDTLLEIPNLLLKFPYSYPIEPFYNNINVRFVTKWSYKLVYYIRNDAIYIMRVFNTNMDAKRILEK